MLKQIAALFTSKFAKTALVVLFLAGALLTTESMAAAQEFGDLKPPPGIDKWQQEAGLDADQPALIFFISRMITLITVLAGIWTLVNVIVAAYHYITGGGSSESHAKVRNMLTMSVIGLLLIVTAYTMGGIIGIIFFGDASYILSPTI